MNAKTTSIPAIYRRDAISKATGCLVYLVAAPFVALMLALFVSVPLMVVLESFGMARERASTPFLVLLPLFLLGVAVWGFLDYRRRANLEVVIDRDHVGIGAGNAGRSCRSRTWSRSDWSPPGPTMPASS